MAASGITQKDIASQQAYLTNPDNITAFNSVLQKTNITSLGDGAQSREYVKPWGLRQVSGYVSPYSGPGFGAQIPSENVITDSTKIKKISFTL